MLQLKLAVKDFEKEPFSNLTQNDLLIILCTGKNVIFVVSEATGMLSTYPVLRDALAQYSRGNWNVNELQKINATQPIYSSL